MEIKMEIKIKRIEDGKLPEYKTVGSVGADCFARIEKDIIIQPGKNSTIPLGFAVEIPDGYEMQIRGRSGLASKSGIEGFTGTIDSDYRGEVSAILFNHSDKDFIIKNGDRIAQAIITPIVKAEWCLTKNLSETKRGEGGFGSTGVSEKNKEIEKFYEPFTRLEEVEPLLNKYVVVDGKNSGRISAVKFNKCLNIEIILDGGFQKIELTAFSAFQRVKIDNHLFGKEIKF